MCFLADPGGKKTKEKRSTHRLWDGMYGAFIWPWRWYDMAVIR